MKALQTKGAKFRAVTQFVKKNHHVKFGILQNYKSETGCMYGHVSSDVLRLRRSPARSRRKVVRKDQLHYWRSLHNWVVYLKILIRESLFFMTKENGDQNTWSNSPSAPGTKKNWERKSPSQAIVQKCEPHEHSPCAPKFWERSHEETLHQERCAWRVAWDLAKILQAQECGKYYGLLSYRSKGNAVTHFGKSRGARIRSRFRSINARDDHHVEETSGKENRRGNCGSWCQETHWAQGKLVLRIRVFHTARVQMTPHRSHTRALFLAAHATCDRSHVWLKGLTILGVSRKLISSLVMSLLNVSSTPFPPFSHRLRTAHLEARFTARWWASSSDIGRDRPAGKVDKCNSGPSGNYGCAYSTDHWGKCRGSGKCLPGVDFWGDSWTNRGCSCVLRLRDKMCE